MQSLVLSGCLLPLNNSGRGDLPLEDANRRYQWKAASAIRGDESRCNVALVGLGHAVIGLLRNLRRSQRRLSNRRVP